MDQEKVRERLAALAEQEQEAFATLWALRGAIKQLEWVLEQLDALPKEEGDDEILAGKQADG